MNFLKKNWWVFIPTLIAIILIFYFKIAIIFPLFFLVVFYIVFTVIKSPFLFTYIKKNWYIIIGLIIAIGYGMHNKDGSYWRSFERASIFMTLIYTAFLYIKMFFDSDIDKKPLIAGVPALGLGMIAIFISGFASVEGNFIFGSTTSYISIPGSRDITLGLLTLGALMYCIVNYNLYKSNTKHKESFLKSLQYSDFPVFITFLILWSTVIPFYNDLHNPVLESFYGGTIAFQMIYSNIVWSFIDDPIIESHLNKNN